MTAQNIPAVLGRDDVFVMPTRDGSNTLFSKSYNATYHSLFGAVAGFVAYLHALRHLPVAFVSLYAYVNPVIAVALGTWLLAEPFNRRMAIAIAAVLLGMTGVSMRPRAQTTEREAGAGAAADR